MKNNDSIYKNKDFMLLIIGAIVSNLGNALVQVAIVWHIISVVSEKESGSALAIFSAVAAVAMILFAPFTGVLADKINRKLAIVGSDIIRGLLLLLLIIANKFSFYPLMSLYVIIFIMTFFSTLFSSAVNAVIPNIVKEDQLIKANAVFGLSKELMIVIGAAIAGFIYHLLGINGILLIDGISFILSGISELFITIPNVKRAIAAEKTSFIKDFKDGIRYIKSKKALLHLGIIAIGINFVGNPIYAVIIPKIVKYDLLRTAKDFGVLESVLSIGAILGMIIISRFGHIKKYFKILFSGLISQCIISILLGISILFAVKGVITLDTGFILMLIIAVFIAMISAFVNVPIGTMFQVFVEDEMRGRVTGMFGTLVQAMVPVGLGIYGILSGIYPNWVIVIGSSIIEILIISTMLFSKEIKNM